MKKQILFLIGLIAANVLLAQVPQGISHQAVIRDANNELVVNAPIGIQVSILQGSAEGEAVYVETHSPISNASGLITYIIGEGVVESGVFAEIDWSAGPYFFKTEADPMGGTDYTITGITQFHSVPYALHSLAAETAETLKNGSHLGEINYWDGENWVPIAPGEHNQTLRLCEGVPTWGPCLYDLVLFSEPLDGGSVVGEGEYEEGTEVSITAIPNQGWEFAGWTSDTDNVDDVDSEQTTLTMPAQNISLTANFQEEAEPTLYNLHLDVHPEGAGTVYGEGEYEYGEEVAVLATAYEGWEFVNWTDLNGNELFDDASVVFEMPDIDLTFIANFQEEESDIIYGDGVTDIDGNEYVTVIVGNQEWMAENLRVTRYNNEDDIPKVLIDWSFITEGGYVIYDHNASNTDGINSPEEMVEAYGKLYNWYAVDDGRGLCPEGWSVPSDDDWTQLVDYIMDEYDYHNDGGSEDINGVGNALKSCRQVDHPDGGDCDTSEHPRWNSHGTHSGFDEFGFSALPGGYRDIDEYVDYESIGNEGYWWSSSETPSTGAWYRAMISNQGNVGRPAGSKNFGFSVRCVRDITEEPTLYNLNLEVNPENSGSVTGADEYQEGETISISATANEGWEFVNWTGDTEYLDDENAANATVTMPAVNITLIANFQEEESDIIYGDGVTDIDGNEYITVIIGDQEWMAENLRVTRYDNGDDIPTGLNDEDWESTTEGAYAVYSHGSIDGLDSDAEVVAAYGKLYNWYAVDDARGLCPEGWSVPGNLDWTALINYVVSQGFLNNNVNNGAGNALKSCRQVDSPLDGCNTSEHPRWKSHWNHSGFDEFGFSALPGGYRSYYGGFGDVGHLGYWWIATEYSGTYAWNRLMSSGAGNVTQPFKNKTYGFSVRCFRDITEEPTLYNLNLELHPEGAGTVSGEGEYEEGELVNVTAAANEGWEFVNWTGDIDHVDDPGSAATTVTMPAFDINLIANFEEEEPTWPPCPDMPTVTDIDGNVYNTVLIGDQCWIRENLRVTKYNNGDAIPTDLSNEDWLITSEGAYAIYNNSNDMLEAYGKLYNWYAVDDARGLCPEGWSVPSDDDWTALVNYVVSQGFPNSSVPNGAGNALKSCRQVGSPLEGCNTSEHPRWNSHSTHYGFDEFGFSALPGGTRWSYGSFSGVGGSGGWWSATESSGPTAWSRHMHSFYGNVNRDNGSKRDGFSIRCLRDID